MIDFSPPESPLRISYDGDFDISRAVTAPPPEAPSEREMRGSSPVVVGVEHPKLNHRAGWKTFASEAVTAM